MARVTVIGAGPSGCVFAGRMAQLGHDVTLIERLTFPRQRLGESLSAGFLLMLEMIGARAAVERAGFSHIHTVSVTWDAGVTERHDPHAQGLLVDRGRFDALLLEQARTLGVRLLQPASVRECQAIDNGWRLLVDCGGSSIDLVADFLVDATGRTGFLRAQRTRQEVSTVAVYAYWEGTRFPEQPTIEAGADAWYWGVPLPDGRYSSLVFLDATTLRAQRGRPLTDVLRDYLDRSQLVSGVVGRVPRGEPAVGRVPRESVK